MKYPEEDTIMVDSRTGEQYQQDNLQNGGPAFGEFHQAGNASVKTGGMTLRDYFAANALQGMSANPYFDDFEFDAVADMAYAQADEMLATRKK